MLTVRRLLAIRNKIFYSEKSMASHIYTINVVKQVTSVKISSYFELSVTLLNIIGSKCNHSRFVHLGAYEYIIYFKKINIIYYYRSHLL